MDPTADIVAHSARDISGSYKSRISQVPRRIPSESSRELPSYAEFQKSDQTNVDPRGSAPCEELLDLYGTFPPGWNNGKPSIISLAYHPIQSVNREWMLYGSLMSRYIKYYEYSFSTVSSRLEHFERHDIVDLHRWRRRSQQTLHKLQMVRLFIEYRHKRRGTLFPQSDSNGETSQQDSSSWDLLLMDIHHLEDQINQHARSIETLNPIITTLVQLIDSHKSIAQAEDIRRLTYIAIAFVPLSYISGIFSMSDPYQPGGKSFWVYWVIAVPVAALIMGSLMLENRIAVLFRLCRRLARN